jgi:hypothetical protein
LVRPADWNCTVEKLTATRMSSGQVCAWRQASLSTHSPIGTIRPVSSAMAMNSLGPSRPRSGWFQRISASNAEKRLLARSNSGWK